MINISNSHLIHGIITIVANEIPIAKEYAMAKADAVDTRIIKKIYGAILLISDVKREKIIQTRKKLNDRPSNVSYFSFQCELDSKIIINSRINYKPL